LKSWQRWFGALAAVTMAWGARADLNSWTSLGPNGGRVFRVAFNQVDPSIVYLVSQGGFSRSTDGGVTWQMIYTDLPYWPYDLAVDPTNPANVYVVGESAPYFLASSDSGRTLTAVPQPAAGPGIAGARTVQVAADGKTIFVAAGGSGIFASTDRGKTWSPRGSFTNQVVWRVFADPRDANTLYASVGPGSGSTSGVGLYVTHDGGQTWTVSNFSTTDSYNNTADLAIDPSNTNILWDARSNGLWVSRDRGITWTLSSYDIPKYGNASKEAVAVAIDPRNPSIIYASDGWGETLRSSDGGVTWTDVTGGSSVMGNPYTIAVSPTNGAVLIGALGGVWGSPTGGAAWVEQVQGLPATNIEQFSANAATDRIYLNTEDSLIGYIANGGSSISLTNREALRQVSPGSFGVYSILAQPGINGKLFASVTGGMASSTDGGESWSVIPLLFDSGTQMSRMATWPGSHIILISGQWAQYRSADDGVTWTPMTAGLPANAVFNSMQATPSDPNVVYASAYSTVPNGPSIEYGVFVSTDTGLTWQRTGADWPTSVGGIEVDPYDAQTFYLGAASGLLKSSDGGKTFAAMPGDKTTRPGLVTIDPVHAQIFYGAGAQGIIRSVDRGLTWQILPASPFSPTYGWSATAITVDPNRPNDVYVGTYSHGAYKLTVAPDLALSIQTAAAQPGSTLSSTYSAVNNGPYDATGAQLVVQLPAGATNISGTVAGGSCASSATLLKCTLPVMRTGASYSFVVNATAPAAGSLSSSATLSADQPDVTSSNNSVATTAAGKGIADLSVKTNGPATAKTGDLLTYTLTISNTGPATALATHLNYQPDSSVQVTNITASSGSCSPPSAGAVTCDLGDIPVAKTVTVTVSAKAMTAGTSNATATVSSQNTSPDSQNTSAGSSTSITGDPVSTGGTSPSSGGGSGGGGALSAPWLLALTTVLALSRRRGAYTRHPG